MAKQTLTITISDSTNDGKRIDMDCNLNADLNEEIGSYSFLIALVFSKNFKSIMDAQAAMIEKERNVILQSKGIH